MRKALKSLESVAYHTFYTLTVRRLLVFSTGRRIFEPEELNPITVLASNTNRTRFHTLYVRIGLTQPSGGACRCIQLIPRPQAAARMLLRLCALWLWLWLWLWLGHLRVAVRVSVPDTACVCACAALPSQMSSDMCSVCACW